MPSHTMAGKSTEGQTLKFQIFVQPLPAAPWGACVFSFSISSLQAVIVLWGLNLGLQNFSLLKLGGGMCSQRGLRQPFCWGWVMLQLHIRAARETALHIAVLISLALWLHRSPCQLGEWVRE